MWRPYYSTNRHKFKEPQNSKRMRFDWRRRLNREGGGRTVAEESPWGCWIGRLEGQMRNRINNHRVTFAVSGCIKEGDLQEWNGVEQEMVVVGEV